MRRVFGPVPSRRLGRSLGIDPLPARVCSFDCVYCQLGRTRFKTVTPSELVPTAEIMDELSDALSRLTEEDVDWITFVGSGETTLHSGLGEMIRQVKAMTSTPVAVITNGSLLDLPEVREGLEAADVVMPSLDAGSPELFERVNRPHQGVSFERHLEGLVAFRRGYAGALWLEVMLVSGLNDDLESLTDLAGAIARVEPDQVHLDLPTRPPAEPWVKPADAEGVMRAQAILGREAKVVSPAEGDFELTSAGDPVAAIVEIISRHPMSREEVAETLGRVLPGAVEERLEEIEASGRVQVVERHGARFWVAPNSGF